MEKLHDHVRSEGHAVLTPHSPVRPVAEPSRVDLSRRGLGRLALGGALAGGLAAGVGGFARPAAAELRIDITQGRVEPLPVAIADFKGPGTDATRVGREIAGVIRADLERSGLFAPIDQQAFIQTDLEFDSVPRFGGRCASTSGCGTCSPSST